MTISRTRATLAGLAAFLSVGVMTSSESWAVSQAEANNWNYLRPNGRDNATTAIKTYIMHRGAHTNDRSKIVENTKEAMIAANADANGAELDIMNTHDQGPIGSHDVTWGRLMASTLDRYNRKTDSVFYPWNPNHQYTSTDAGPCTRSVQLNCPFGSTDFNDVWNKAPGLQYFDWQVDRTTNNKPTYGRNTTFEIQTASSIIRHALVSLENLTIFLDTRSTNALRALVDSLKTLDAKSKRRVVFKADVYDMAGYEAGKVDLARYDVFKKAVKRSMDLLQGFPYIMQIQSSWTFGKATSGDSGAYLRRQMDNGAMARDLDSIGRTSGVTDFAGVEFGQGNTGTAEWFSANGLSMDIVSLYNHMGIAFWPQGEFRVNGRLMRARADGTCCNEIGLTIASIGGYYEDDAKVSAFTLDENVQGVIDISRTLYPSYWNGYGG